VSKVHAGRSGYLTKTTLPTITRFRGPTTTVAAANVIVTGNGVSGDGDTASINDYSGNNYKIFKGENLYMVPYGPFLNGSGQSVYCNGYSYMALPGPTGTIIGTQDFTIEFFVRSKDWSKTTTIAFFYKNGVLSTADYLHIAAVSGALRVAAGTTDPAISGGTMAANTWYHIALVRIGGSTKLYLNGVQTGSTLVDTRSYGTPGIASTTPQGPGPILLSDANYSFSGSSSNSHYGWISNYRIVVGYGVYTGTFAPPTANLQNSGSGSATSYSSTTNVNITFPSSACQLLFANGSNSNYIDDICGQTNSGVLIGGLSPTFINAGNNPTTNIVKSGLVDLSPYAGSPGSMHIQAGFDGIETASYAGFTLGTGDFTIECWMWMPKALNTSYLVDFRNSTATDVAPTIIYNVAASRFEYQTAGTARITGTAGTRTISTWYHIAVVRISGTTKMYINGVQDGANYTDANSYVNTKAWIGTIYTQNGASGRNYISDFRLIKGVGVYTGTFTPPTSRLANSGAGSAASYPSTTNINTSFASSACSSLIPFSQPSGSLKSETEATVYMPLPVFVNTVTVDTTVYKTASGSINFGNSATSGSQIFVPGDWRIPASTAGTVEAWYNFNTYTGTQVLWAIGNNGTYTTTPFKLGVINGSLCVLSQSNTSLATLGSLSAGNIGQWQHIALVRAAGAIRVYVNGVQLGSDYTYAATSAVGNAYGLYIGNHFSQTTGAGYPYAAFRGYMDSFKLTCNYALYSGNFTPSTAEVTSTSNTYAPISNAVYGLNAIY